MSVADILFFIIHGFLICFKTIFLGDSNITGKINTCCICILKKKHDICTYSTKKQKYEKDSFNCNDALHVIGVCFMWRQ